MDYKGCARREGRGSSTEVNLKTSRNSEFNPQNFLERPMGDQNQILEHHPPSLKRGPYLLKYQAITLLPNSP
jgi:hypothetical protein